MDFIILSPSFWATCRALDLCYDILSLCEPRLFANERTRDVREACVSIPVPQQEILVDLTTAYQLVVHLFIVSGNAPSSLTTHRFFPDRGTVPTPKTIIETPPTLQGTTFVCLRRGGGVLVVSCMAAVQRIMYVCM